MRNDIPLPNPLGGESHFSMHEFENTDGWVMIDESVLESLEKTRRDLCDEFRFDVAVIITDATRTEAETQALAAHLGWKNKGGLVSESSRHHERYGGLAVDLKARVVLLKTLVHQHVLGRACRRYFDYVKDDYDDGHVHCDNRNHG